MKKFMIGCLFFFVFGFALMSLVDFKAASAKTASVDHNFYGKVINVSRAEGGLLKVTYLDCDDVGNTVEHEDDWSRRNNSKDAFGSSQLGFRVGDVVIIRTVNYQKNKMSSTADAKIDYLAIAIPR